MYTPIFGLGEPPEVVNPRYFWHATGGKKGSGAGGGFRESKASGGSRKWGPCGQVVWAGDVESTDPLVEMSSLRLREAKLQGVSGRAEQTPGCLPCQLKCLATSWHPAFSP